MYKKLFFVNALTMKIIVLKLRIIFPIEKINPD